MIKKNHDILKVSIVTVVYNAKEDLEKTIESVLEQDYSKIEYIIIDGGSSDGTLDIIKKYQNRINYWISEKDNGIYDAMNKGIKFASGAYINFLNAGDLYSSLTVVSNISSKIREKNCKIIYGNVVYNRKDGSLFIDDKSRKKSSNIYEINHQSCFYSLNLHKQYGLYSLDYKISSDFLFLNSVIKVLDNEPFKVDFNIVEYDEGGFSRVNILEHQWEKIKISMRLYGINFYIFSPLLIIIKVLIKKVLGRKN